MVPVGNDMMNTQSTSYFWPCRPYPQQLYGEQSLQHPLIGTRADLSDSRLGETFESIGILERLLRCPNEEAHQALAEALWDR